MENSADNPIDVQPLGQRRTRQRQVIETVIRDAAGPLTVNEVHQQALRELDNLGIATVYRTLKLLLDGDRIETVILPSGETRYEATGLGHHHHFHCRRCDLVFDLETCPVSVPTGNYEQGFIVDAHELTLYGTCPQCALECGLS